MLEDGKQPAKGGKGRASLSLENDSECMLPAMNFVVSPTITIPSQFVVSENVGRSFATHERMVH